MTTLYELDRQIMLALTGGFEVDEETGEVFFCGDYLETLKKNRADKLEAIACYIKNLEAEAAALKAEETALAARRKVKAAKAARMREYIADSLHVAGESRFETARCALAFRKSEAVEILDADELPDAYLKHVAPMPDKAAIKKALKAGEDVSGAQLIVKQNIQIK